MIPHLCQGNVEWSIVLFGNGAVVSSDVLFGNCLVKCSRAR